MPRHSLSHTIHRLQTRESVIGTLGRWTPNHPPSSSQWMPGRLAAAPSPSIKPSSPSLRTRSPLPNTFPKVAGLSTMQAKFWMYRKPYWMPLSAKLVHKISPPLASQISVKPLSHGAAPPANPCAMPSCGNAAAQLHSARKSAHPGSQMTSGTELASLLTLISPRRNGLGCWKTSPMSPQPLKQMTLPSAPSTAGLSMG